MKGVLRMKRMFSLLLAIAMVLTVLAACSNSSGDQMKNASNEPQSGGNATEMETVTIKFWRPNGNDAENAAINKLIENFEAQNPGIKVELENIPYDQYETKLRTALAGKTAADVIAIDSPTMSSYAYAGALYDLTPFFEADGNLEDIPDGIVESMKYNGKIYIAPLPRQILPCFTTKKCLKPKGFRFHLKMWMKLGLGTRSSMQPRN